MAQIQPATQVMQLPYQYPAAREKAKPWFREWRAELDQTPSDSAELAGALEKHLPLPSQRARQGLEEIRRKVEERRPPKARWTLANLTLGAKKAQKDGPLFLNAELVHTALYAKRGRIAFEGERIEDAASYLCRLAKLSFARLRLQNPPVTWAKENVSVFEALDAILTLHGFQTQYWGIGQKVSVEANLYDTRESFVRDAVRIILDAGENLDRDIPAMAMQPIKKTKHEGGEEPRQVPPPAPSKG
jgi:hypothetical protein